MSYECDTRHYRNESDDFPYSPNNCPEDRPGLFGYDTPFRAHYVCCICSYTITRYSDGQDFDILRDTYTHYVVGRGWVTFSTPDLGMSCRGGCGHKVCRKCRSSVEGRSLSCWACTGDSWDDEDNVFFRYVVREVDGKRRCFLYDSEMADGGYCRKCGYVKGSNCIKGWKALPWICEEIGTCWFVIKKQGERGHFCVEAVYSPEVAYGDWGPEFEEEMVRQFDREDQRARQREISQLAGEGHKEEEEDTMDDDWGDVSDSSSDVL